MAQLAGHGSELAVLQEQPFEALFAVAPCLRHEAPGLFREVDKDRTRFEHRHRTVRLVVVDNRRHAVVGANRQKFRLELVAAADIDRDHTIFEAAFLEHDCDLPAVWGRPIIEVDHRTFSERSAAISAAEYPSWAKTSCVCSPSSGAPWRMPAGVREKRAAGRDWRRRPAAGCSVSTTISTCCTLWGRVNWVRAS